ncbi:hypothetical protein AALA17_04145 [Lactobacillaceae bacterium 24-114]
MYNAKYELIMNCELVIAHGREICRMIDFPESFQISKIKWHFSLIDEISKTIETLSSQFDNSISSLLENFLGNVRYIKIKYRHSQESGNLSSTGIKEIIETLDNLFRELINSVGKNYLVIPIDDILY